ncbi:MAG: efflux RND transporter permease subunit [Deltaproteobacteria bacterium]|nr:efflux RND transporter permease subunit [Deltaproteobacteria bacterium]
MQWLAAVCVRRPVFATVLMLILSVVGVFAYGKLGVDRFPKIDFPVVAVITALPGAAPEEVETEISDKLEAAINTISGIDELRSSSAEGVSQVIVTFVLDKDVDVAAQEVREKVAAAQRELPAGIDPPVVSKMDPDASPVLTLAVTGSGNARETSEFADKKLRRELESLGGVGQVLLIGARPRQVNVTIDPSKLLRYGVTAAEVERALRSQNIELPSGRVEQGPRQLTLRTQGRIEQVGDFANIYVATRDGVPIKLGDVARVEDGVAEPESVGYKAGKSSILLNIRKQSGTNTVQVVKNVKERLDEVRKRLPPGFSVEVARDQSEFIENAIGAVKEHLVLGALCAAIIVFVFLGNARSTIIAAVAIPISIISTFGVMQAAGFTLNAITLLALTLAVGIVIDDAIVVLEIIWRDIDERGMDPVQAALHGTQEIGLAVLATTLSLVAVFLPVAFMGGIVGRFMNSFGLTMSFSIMVSLLVSFSLTPMMCSRWLRRKLGKDGKPAASHAHGGETGGIYAWLERGYLVILGWSLRHRWVVVLACVAALASIPLLGKSAKANFLPDEDESQLQISLRTPEGTSLDQTRVLATRLARDVEAVPGVRYAVTTIGDDPQKTPNLASIYVKLVPVSARKLSQIETMAKVRDEVVPRHTKPGFRVAVSQVSPFSGGQQNFPVMYQVTGPDMVKISEYVDKLLTTLKAQPGVVDPDTSLIVGKPELRAHIDRAKAAELGVSVADVASALRLLVGGYEVTTFNENAEQYEVHARAEASHRADLQGLARLSVPSSKLGAVTLDNLVSFSPGEGPSKIDRYNRRRSAMVMCNVAKGASTRAIVDALDSTVAKMNLAPGYSAAAAGQSRELGRAAKNFGLAFAMSFIFMYLVLAAQFESWLHPITILLSLPLTVPFAVLSVILFDQSLNIFSMLGILVLFGVVKKNSILQIDHTLALRRAGLPRHEAMMRANRDRLRPILMTTAAFVAGMIPLVLSSGAGAGTNRATGFVIIGGQTFSLLLTLVATPVAYSLFDDLSNWASRQWNRLFGRAGAAAPLVVESEPPV